MYLTPHGGTPTLLGSANYPAGWSVTEPMANILSFSLRELDPTQNPTWTDPQHIQVWARKVLTTDLTRGFYGGGVAPGTKAV